MKHFTAPILYALATVLMITIFSACAVKKDFEKSVVVPSASGQVKVKKDANNNYAIDISVRDLTTPNQLVPAKKVYIVWNETNNGTFSLGQLVSSRSFLARGFKGSLEAVSPNKPNRVFITAEEDANTQFPGTQVVLTTSNF